MKKLENKDTSLAHRTIPLGSCTWISVAPLNSHPSHGKNLLISLCASGTSPGIPAAFPKAWVGPVWTHRLKPTLFWAYSRAQGEYAGLATIREYLDKKEEWNRMVCLSPKSAHWMNPASAYMAGMKIQSVEVDRYGNISVAHLKAMVDKYKENLATIMITYLFLDCCCSGSQERKEKK